VKDFKKLKVWEKAHALTLRIYQVSRSFPREELYGLTSQMRRAAASIPTNIAEGYGRGRDTEFARFMEISSGSSCELEYQLMLAHDLKYLPRDELESLSAELAEVKRMLNVFVKKLKAIG